MNKIRKIRYYLYNYNVSLENNIISYSSIVERNYIKSFENNKKIIEDVKKNNFLIFNPFRKNFLIKLNRFIKRLLKEICSSPFKYSLDISYNYTKSKSDNSIKKKYDVFYELNINCYDEKRKIGFHKKIKTKALNFNKLKSEIFCYEEILKNKINANEGIINSGQVLFEKYAFSQIMSNYKKELWNIRKFINVESKIIIFKGRTCKASNKNKMNFNTALNEITDCKYLMFKNSNVINNPLLELKKGYVILNIYFLNNNKEHRNYIKILCSGYYLEEGKIKFIFTNKIFHFNLLSLINDIEYVSSSSCFSNDFICPDVLTKI